MAEQFRLDIDESAVYEGERRVLKLDTGGGVENYTNDNWRAAIDIGARIVKLLNAVPHMTQPCRCGAGTNADCAANTCAKVQAAAGVQGMDGGQDG